MFKVKTDCRYLYPVGNLCSKLGSDMIRCADVIECDKKYIDALKQENKLLKDTIKDKNIVGIVEENEWLKNEKKINLQRANALNRELNQLHTCLHEIKEKVEKYRTCLQEIKAIVCGNYEIIDPQGRKDILKLITKAEEE